MLALFHPMPTDDSPYEGIKDDVDLWLVVHVGQLILTPFLFLAVWRLLDGISSLASTISRCALVVWTVFFSAYDSCRSRDRDPHKARGRSRRPGTRRNGGSNRLHRERQCTCRKRLLPGSGCRRRVVYRRDRGRGVAESGGRREERSLSQRRCRSCSPRTPNRQPSGCSPSLLREYSVNAKERSRPWRFMPAECGTVETRAAVVVAHADVSLCAGQREGGSPMAHRWHIRRLQRAFRRTEEPLRELKLKPSEYVKKHLKFTPLRGRAGRLDDRASRRRVVHVLHRLPAPRRRPRPAGEVRGGDGLDRRSARHRFFYDNMAELLGPSLVPSPANVPRK